MRLHQTTCARITLSSGFTIRTAGNFPMFCKGLLDKTDTLSLVKRNGLWNVSVQRSGYRLIGYRTRAHAREYMEYMLEHAQKTLQGIPQEYDDARVYAGAHLRAIHHEARGWVKRGGP